MANINISTIEYEVDLVVETYNAFRLGGAVLDLHWEEHKGELAQRATMVLANCRLENADTMLFAVMKINCGIQIWARWNGEGRQRVFDGTIWEWQYTNDTQREIRIVAYDRLIRLRQSKDFKYYNWGMTTRQIVNDICSTWGIPFAYTWNQDRVNPKLVYSGMELSDILLEVLDRASNETGVPYVVYWRDGRMEIRDIGLNQPGYIFDEPVTVSTYDNLHINNLVTRVAVLATQDNDGREALEAWVDGDTSFGVLQKIVRRNTNDSLDFAIRDAVQLIKERGRPEETVQVTAPDVPFLRKGDKVEMAAGNLKGYFLVEGVSHFGTTRQMDMVLARFERKTQNVGYTIGPDGRYRVVWN